MSLVIAYQFLILCIGLYLVIKGADVLLSSAISIGKKNRSIRFFCWVNYYWFWNFSIRVISLNKSSIRKLAKLISGQCYWVKYF